MRSGVGCRDALGDDPSASMGSRGISCGFCSMSREQGARGSLEATRRREVGTVSSWPWITLISPGST